MFDGSESPRRTAVDVLHVTHFDQATLRHVFQNGEGCIDIIGGRRFGIVWGIPPDAQMKKDPYEGNVIRQPVGQ